MLRGDFRVICAILVAAVATALPAQGQICWDLTPGQPGANHRINAMAVWDDGNGPALYVAGLFTEIGGQAVNRIARWDGVTWSPLGTGVSGEVLAMIVHDDGTGPALYVGGLFGSAGGVPGTSRLARWDGNEWSSIGSANGPVRSLVSYDHGSGPALYAGGLFTEIGGQAVNRIARWDGVTWSPLGTGVSGEVLAMVVHDDGFGSALYVGGVFGSAGGVPDTGHLAVWDGTAWLALPQTPNDHVRRLLAVNGKDGSWLYVAGSFTEIGDLTAWKIARWNGTEWSGMGDLLDHDIEAMAYYDDGSGPRLYVGGTFAAIGATQASGIAAWDGTTWSPVGRGFENPRQVLVVHPVDNVPGIPPALMVGGGFQASGGVQAGRLAAWRYGASGDVKSVTIAPDVTTLTAGFLASWEATATLPGGQVIDVTACAAWSSDDESIAVVTRDGLIEARSGGTTMIRAEVAGVQAAEPLEVLPSACEAASPLCCLGTCYLDSDCCLDSWHKACGAMAGPCATYQVDDGGSSQSWSMLGTQVGTVIVWMNRFEVAEGNETIDTIHLRWATGNEGHPRTLHLWVDALETGVVADAKTIVAIETDAGPPGQFFTYAIPPTYIGPSGTVFYVGVHAVAIQVPPSPRMAAEWRYPVFAGTSYIFPKLTGGMGPDELREALLGFDFSGFYNSNFLIRAEGVPGKPGDLNGDNVVDVLDLLLLLDAWGSCSTYTCAADFNRDGLVDVLDLIILLDNWG
jgi:hypothetical protein